MQSDPDVAVLLGSMDLLWICHVFVHLLSYFLDTYGSAMIALPLNWILNIIRCVGD